MVTGMATRTPAPQVGTTTSIAPRELSTYYKNARRGDVPAIAASLKAHDQYKPIVVNVGTHTGRANEVLAGNHTLMAFRDLAERMPDDERWSNILVHWVDVDEDRAARIVLTDNKTAELGGYDDALLYELVTGLGENLEGTGFTDLDLEMLEKAAADAADGLSGDGDGESERGNGEKLALWGSTLGEPDVKPEPGSVWSMGHHTVVVASVHLEWARWMPMLTEGMVFAPYPSLMLPYVDKAVATPMLMVQPDPYIAGWLLTKWNRLNPDAQAVKQ
jgi:hypothetical protein